MTSNSEWTEEVNQQLTKVTEDINSLRCNKAIERYWPPVVWLYS